MADQRDASEPPAKRAKVAEPNRRGHARIGVYNYKGGVGKTTITLNLAATLAKEGYKTLMVDFDPQCNLTDFFTREHDQDDEYDEDSDDNDGQSSASAASGDQKHSDGEDLNDSQSDVDSQPATVRPQEARVPIKRFPMPSKCPVATDPESLPSRRGGSGNLYEALQNSWNRRLDSFEASLPKTDVVLKDVGGIGENLAILRGSPFIIEYETYLGKDLHLELVGAFSHLLNRLCERDGYKFVLVDMGPNAGFMNKVICLSCDAILPPAFPDYFSYCSIRGLLHVVLPDWIQWREEHLDPKFQDELKKPISKERKSQLAKYRLPRRLPRLLPVIISRFSMHDKKVTLSHARWTKAIEQVVQPVEPSAPAPGINLTTGSHNKQAGPPAKVTQLYTPDSTGCMVIPFLKTIQAAQQLSQERSKHSVRKPLVMMDGDDIQHAGYYKRSSDPKSSLMKDINWAKDHYPSLAQFIVSLDLPV